MQWSFLFSPLQPKKIPGKDNSVESYSDGQHFGESYFQPISESKTK